MSLSDEWTDDELITIMDEPGTWIVSGQSGRHLCFTTTLRAAIERGSTFAQAGAIVTKLSRQPSDNIIVLPRQMRQLGKLISSMDVPTAY